MNNSHLEIAIGSIKCFTDDGTLDMNELNCLLGIALRDGEVDDDEKRVLSNIFSKIAEPEVTADVWQKINEAKQKYGIS